MKFWNLRLLGTMAAGVVLCSLFFTAPASADAPAVSTHIYEWVQSTARQNYYFNKQQFYFAALMPRHPLYVFYIHIIHANQIIIRIIIGLF